MKVLARLRVSPGTVLYAVAAFLTAILDKITEATAWSDVFSPAPTLSGLLAACLIAAAHLSKRPFDKSVERVNRAARSRERAIRDPGGNVP